MLRPVRMPDGVAGGLWLSGMPGYHEPLEHTWDQVRRRGVQAIVCLAGPDEVHLGSPSYAAALEAKRLPCPVEPFPIPDLGAPDDREAFWALASKIAAQLQAGGRVMVHCRAGIGRTGTLATCILLALGEPWARAEQAVSAAGSRPETAEQGELVAWFATRARPTQ